MSDAAIFFALAAIEVAGFFIIWFRLKAKVGKYLELEHLLDGVREEARALVMELNETADRNVSLVEDRIAALRELLDEVDRRIGVEKRELEKRSVEREVYSKLARRRPIVPAAEASPPAASGGLQEPSRVPEAPKAAEIRRVAEPRREAEPARGYAETVLPPQRPLGSPIQLSLGAAAEAEESARPAPRSAPEVVFAEDVLVNSKSKREEALDLYRQGISADLIAARLGATVAEIELLVELEERRRSAGGGAPGKDR